LFLVRHRYSNYIVCTSVKDTASILHLLFPEVIKIYGLLPPLIYSETCNELAKELGGYKHVAVAHDIKVVDEGTSQALQNLSAGSVHGDCILLVFDFILILIAKYLHCYINFLDAVVVGLDMLIRKFGNTKGKRRLCLITSAQHPLRDPPEGTKEDQVDTIADQMKRHDIKMECIVFREPGVHHNTVLEENDRLLYQFRNRSVTKVVHVDSPTSLLGALKTRNVIPVTVFRGDLEVSSNLKIKVGPVLLSFPWNVSNSYKVYTNSTLLLQFASYFETVRFEVWVYKKTAEEKFPTLKKYSDKAPPSDKFASHEVKVDYEYRSVVEPDKVVPPDQRIKGYLYGPQVVPISSAEWEAVKFKPEKGVKLLGFTDRSSILRHHFMKDACLFIPEPGNTKATLAVSAIARAMHQMNKAAVVRCVWRQGQGNVAFGVLTPNISSVNNVQDSFYFNVLPFAEDIREFQFRSFSSLPSSSQPTEEQQEAADNLVKMLDLAPPGREVLKPEFTPNPMLEVLFFVV
ncbi:ATP-dependent DNA helicase 2 subunit KU80, partial [Dichanthelium oligosanthes]